MATNIGSGERDSYISTKVKSNNDVINCKKCLNYEFLLNEALEELNSLRAANKLLQRELLAHGSPETTWKINQNSTHNLGKVNDSDKWTVNTTKNRSVKIRDRGQSAIMKAGLIIKTVNRYTPLTKVHDDNVVTTPVIVNGDISSKSTTKVNTRNTSRRVNSGIGGKKQRKNKIIVIGDSHARGCAREIANCLGKEFEVSGTVMPGAGLTHITTLAQEGIPNLTPHDSVVIWGGANDINKNEATHGLSQLLNFVNHTSNTNIITLAAPHRHDLQQTSCVNKEIQTFNRKLHKILKASDNVSVIDIDLHRSNFTRHGLHLNTTGKENLAEIIARNIKQLRAKKKDIPIPIDEEGTPKNVQPEPHETTTCTMTNTSSTGDTVPDGSLQPPRTSGRQKKPPVTRHGDFLWLTGAAKATQ